MFWGEGVKGNGMAEVYRQKMAKVNTFHIHTYMLSKYSGFFFNLFVCLFLFYFWQSSKLNSTQAKIDQAYDQDMCIITLSG